MEKSNRKINAKIHLYCFTIKVSQNNNNINNNNKLSVIQVLLIKQFIIIIGRKRMS